MPFCFDRWLACATRDSSGRGGSRERGFSLRIPASARFYELMSISVPEGTPEELIETSESVAGYVTDAGGRVLRSSTESPWGRRRLAYPIRHNSADLRDGFYTLYHFEIQPDRIEDIERELRLNERVIRHLLLQLESEPIFVEPEDEVTEEVTVVQDAETGEVAVVDEVVTATEDVATGEVAVVDDVETLLVDAEGTIESVEVETETVVVDAVGEVEAINLETESAVVDAADEIEVIDVEAESVVIEAGGEVETVDVETESVVGDAEGNIESVDEDTEGVKVEEKQR